MIEMMIEMIPLRQLEEVIISCVIIMLLHNMLKCVCVCVHAQTQRNFKHPLVSECASCQVSPSLMALGGRGVQGCP